MKTTTHENPPTTDAAIDTAVREAIDLINRTLVRASKNDLASKYLVGAKVEEIRTIATNEKYGKKAVATIARAVRLTASCLYSYADVARTWDQGTFDEVSLRAAKAGLTFSHFIELKHEDHAARRVELLEEAIENGKSVRDLRKHRADHTPKATPAPSGIQLTAEDEAHLDILNRLAAEGPTDEIRKAIDAELEELHRRDAELQRRVDQLEAARAMWAESSAEGCTDLGKAAE